nr:type II restriction endonuclease [Parvibaculum indicum]
MARTAFLEKNGLEKLDPFALENPGDVLREISRSIEWELFKEFQRRERAVELVRLVLGDKPRKVTASEVIRRLVDELPAIDALMLSASQQRKSRAGYSYEHHIEAMLLGGSIPHEKQVVIASRKRPDFVLPSLAFVDSKTEDAATGLILSAKTTLRERWKQVEREKGDRQLFLTTVDENIAGSTIEDMDSIGVCLVIPESLRKSRETEYSGHENVVSFREFCDEFVQPHLILWNAAMA